MPQDVGIARHCEGFHATEDQLTGCEHQYLSALQTIPASATVETSDETSRKSPASARQSKRVGVPGLSKISMRAKVHLRDGHCAAQLSRYLPDARASSRVRVRKAFGAAPHLQFG